MVMAIRMATVMVIPTATAMVMVTEATNTVTMATAMDIRARATDPVTTAATAIAATPEWPSYSAGSPVPVITVDPLTAFSARRRVEQFAPTSATTEMLADPVLPGRLVRTGAVSIAFV